MVRHEHTLAQVALKRESGQMFFNPEENGICLFIFQRLQTIFSSSLCFSVSSQRNIKLMVIWQKFISEKNRKSKVVFLHKIFYFLFLNLKTKRIISTLLRLKAISSTLLKCESCYSNILFFKVWIKVNLWHHLFCNLGFLSQTEFDLHSMDI